jgi:hypothetical protein
MRVEGYNPKITTTKEGRIYITNKDFFESKWFKDELPKLIRFENRLKGKV